MDSKRARELLAQERLRIERALAERRDPVAAGELSDQDQHLGDAASELHERELEEGLAEQFQSELATVERAEARLAGGSYGISVESGEQIPDARLEAFPLAERTVAEERGFERG